MADLSSLPINTSYPGVLNLETATTGITQSIQALQDGLGNNTGVKIAQNRFEGANIFNIYRPSVAKYYGTGFANTAASTSTNSSNLVGFVPFYDIGVNSYSAFTINITTLAASESIDIAFYNAQYLEPYGYVPYQKLDTEINISAASTGLKTGTFSSPISFSGTGPGFYFIVFRNNSGAATPVMRSARPIAPPGFYVPEWLMIANLGIVPNANGGLYNNSYMVNGSASITNFYNIASFPTTWTSTEFNTITNGSSANIAPGFVLHTSI